MAAHKRLQTLDSDMSVRLSSCVKGRSLENRRETTQNRRRSEVHIRTYTSGIVITGTTKCHDSDAFNSNNIIIIIILKLYCHFQHALHVKLECSLALIHTVPYINIYIYIYIYIYVCVCVYIYIYIYIYIIIYIIKLNMANKYIIYSVHDKFFKM